MSYVPQGITGMEKGKFTRRRDIVKGIARGLKESTSSEWRAITDYLDTFRGPLDEKTKGSEFRKRTASEILASRRLNGCTDRALAFLALSREMRVPALYVETFERTCLERGSGDDFKGHIFVDLEIDGYWLPYDIETGFVDQEERSGDGFEYHVQGFRYVEVGKGVDFSAVYIRQPDGTYSEQPVAMDGLPKLRKLRADLRAQANQRRL